MRWPAREDLEYVRLLLTVLLLAVVFPLVLAHVLANPQKAADKALGGAVR